MQLFSILGAVYTPTPLAVAVADAAVGQVGLGPRGRRGSASSGVQPTRNLASLGLVSSLWLLSLALLPGLCRAEGAALELSGTWFVLIHYQDKSGANPDAIRWLDRVWTFEMKGSRLQWADYPIVVVSDKSGRFEAAAGNPRSRVLAGWEPNEGQLSEIMRGPRVNSRGMKSKSLRRTQSGDWASMSRNAVRSASVMNYQETWSIISPTAKPRFAMLDSLGSAPNSGDQGGTTYEVTEVSDDGNELRGTYQRDEIKYGSFRLFRTPAIRGLASSEDSRSVNERAMEELRQEAVERGISLEPSDEPPSSE